MSYANPYRAPQSILSKFPVAAESYPAEIRHVAEGFGYQAAVVRTALLGLLGLGGLMFLGATRLVVLTPEIMLVLGGILSLVLFVLQLMAYLSFSKSPAETGARGTANFGMIMFLLGSGSSVVSLVLSLLRVLPSPVPLVMLLGLSMICSLTAALTLMVYFRQIARFLQDDFATYITNSLVNSAVIMYLAIGLVLLISLTGMNPMFGRGGHEIAMPLAIISGLSSFVAGLMSLYVTVVYLVTIGGMKRLLENKLRRS